VTGKNKIRQNQLRKSKKNNNNNKSKMMKKMTTIKKKETKIKEIRGKMKIQNKMGKMTRFLNIK